MAANEVVKRNLGIKILDAQPIENALGGNVRQIYKLKKGLTQELAKKIENDYKGLEVDIDEVFVSDGAKCDCGNIVDIEKIHNAKKYFGF